MKLFNPAAQIFVPDGLPLEAALRRITHLGIGAHQDDLEFMAFHGILECFRQETKWFGGVTCTNGAGSSRTGAYAHFDDAGMQALRQREQNAAAMVGEYGVMLQLDYSSHEVKSATAAGLPEELTRILEATRPEVVYTHNLADKHETHIGVVVATLQALRALPRAWRPAHVYGCEVWRDLDWLLDHEKVALDVSANPSLAAALNGIFDSQIAGGKRYDLAIAGRRCVNATFFDAHTADTAAQVCFAMDLTPLVADESIDPVDYVSDAIQRFQADVQAKLRRRLG